MCPATSFTVISKIKNMPFWDEAAYLRNNKSSFGADILQPCRADGVSQALRITRIVRVLSCNSLGPSDAYIRQ